MYVVDEELSVNWILPPNQNPPAFGDLDIILQKPNGEVVDGGANSFENTYTDSGIVEADYIAPTDELNGAVTYVFTPDAEGVWTVTLSIGTGTAHEVQYAHYLVISSPETIIRQQVIIPTP